MGIRADRNRPITLSSTLVHLKQQNSWWRSAHTNNKFGLMIQFWVRESDTSIKWFGQLFDKRPCSRVYEHFAAARSTESSALPLFALDSRFFSSLWGGGRERGGAYFTSSMTTRCLQGGATTTLHSTGEERIGRPPEYKYTPTLWKWSITRRYGMGFDFLRSIKLCIHIYCICIYRLERNFIFFSERNDEKYSSKGWTSRWKAAPMIQM